MLGFFKQFRKTDDEYESDARDRETRRSSKRHQASVVQGNLEAERIAQEVHLSNLRDEYELCKEGIYENLKAAIQNKQYDDAQVSLERYYEVAKDDRIFMGLYEQFMRLREKDTNLAVLSNQLAALPSDDYNGKLGIYNQLIAIAPDNNEFRNGKIAVLKELYNNTADIKSKVNICNEILLLEPDNKTFKKEFQKCEAELKKANIDSAHRRHAITELTTPSAATEGTSDSKDQCPATYNSQQPSIGRAIWFSKLDLVYESQNDNILSKGDKVTLRVHTHGISITSMRGVYQIHYTQIQSMQRKEPGGGLLSTVAGAVVGGLVGGVVGALIGGGVGASSSSSDMLCISYHRPPYLNAKEIRFGVRGKFSTNAGKQIDKFIQKYYKEIQITKSTGRKAVRGNFGRRLLLVLFLLVVAAGIAFGVMTYRNDIAKLEPAFEPQVVTSSEPQKSTETPKTPDSDLSVIVDSEEWNADAPDRCSFKKAGTTLVLNGTSTENAVLEVLGIQTPKDNVLVGFDKKSPKQQKCTSVGSAIRLSPDQRFVKNMRNANNMTITIQIDDTTKREITYSLNGFSKACRWTK